jgi:hypothetical protein
MFRFILMILALLFGYQSQAQEISGSLTQVPSQPIRPESFKDLQTYTISGGASNESGSFQLS